MLSKTAAFEGPSKPQLETYEIAKKLFKKVELGYWQSIEGNYYSIDIALPKCRIAIEYDGSYWHKDQKKDLIRQNALEQLGWRFIRYWDYVPTKEEMKDDIKIILKDENIWIKRDKNKRYMYSMVN